MAEPKYLSGNHLAGCGDDREPSTRSLQASESISHLITGGCIRDHTPAQRRAGASRAKTTAAHAAQLAQQAPALWFNSLHSPTPPRASTSKHEPPAGTRPHQDREQRPARQRASKTASQPASQPASQAPKGGRKQGGAGQERHNRPAWTRPAASRASSSACLCAAAPLGRGRGCGHPLPHASQGRPTSRHLIWACSCWLAGHHAGGEKMPPAAEAARWPPPRREMYIWARPGRRL